jgi:hypothetical protein
MTGDDTVKTVTLTVNTTGANGVISDLRPVPPPSSTGLSALWVLPPGLFFLAIPFALTVAIPGRRKKGTQRPRYLGLALVLLLGAFTVSGMTACSGVSSPAGRGGTPPGQYSVSAAASVSGSNSHSALVTITITQ